MRVRLLFEPRDLWIGAYWKTVTETTRFQTAPFGVAQTFTFLSVYVCIVPMLPLLFTFRWRVPS